MAFNSDPQNFEQYVRQSVEHVHRVPSEEVWEQLAGRLDAWEEAANSTSSPAKTSGKLKIIAWPVISMLAAAATWVLLMVNGDSNIEQLKPSPASQSVPLVQHITPEQTGGNNAPTVSVPIDKQSFAQHIPTANQSSDKQVATTITHSQSAPKQTDTDVTQIRLSFPDSNASKSMNFGRLERIPLPNPWSKSLSFDYPKHTAPAFFAKAQHEQLIAEDDPKQKKINFNFPKLSLKSMRKGKDWDYQIGIVAASFASKNRIRRNYFEPWNENFVSKNSETEIGVQSEWVISERLRIGSGFRIARAIFHLNPKFLYDPFVFDLLEQHNIELSELEKLQSATETYIIPQANLQGKLVLNPSSQKTRFFTGFGVRWLIEQKNRQNFVVQLKNDRFLESNNSKKVKPLQKIGFARAFIGMEWPFIPALRAQLSCFAQFRMPDFSLADETIRPRVNTGSIIGVEGAIYFTGNRGYFRSIR